MIPFARRRGSITAKFTASETRVLRDITGQLVTLLQERLAEDLPDDTLYEQTGIGGSAAAPVDPALARLLPDAYRNDPAAASDHRRLTERALVDRKIAGLRAISESLEGGWVTLDERLEQAWLRGTNDIRIVISERLGIDADGELGLQDTEEQQALGEIYEWLGYLQGSLVEALEES